VSQEPRNEEKTTSYDTHNDPLEGATGEWTQIPFEIREPSTKMKPPSFVVTPPEEPTTPPRRRFTWIWVIAVILILAVAVYFGTQSYRNTQAATLRQMQESQNKLNDQLSEQSQDIADLKLQLQSQISQNNALRSSLDQLSQTVSEIADVDPDIYIPPVQPEITPEPTSGTNATLTIAECAEKMKSSVVCIREIATSSYYSSLYGSWGGGATSKDVILSEGSGIIYTAGGKIITNYHVVSYAVTGRATVEVILPTGESVEARIIGADELTDLALLQANATSLVPAEFGDSNELVVGETAVAIGNPLGSDLSGSVTAGIVSALNRTIDSGNPGLHYIQTDAAINPGNSGGALVNSRGQVIGINTSKISATDVEGLGFAIPTSIAIPVIEELSEFGKVTGRAALEATAFDVTSILAWRYGCPQGVCIDSLSESLQEEGLQVSDIITMIDGKDIASYAEMVKLISSSYHPGDQVTFHLFRYQSISKTFKEMDVTVTLVEE